MGRVESNHVFFRSAWVRLKSEVSVSRLVSRVGYLAIRPVHIYPLSQGDAWKTVTDTVICVSTRSRSPARLLHSLVLWTPRAPLGRRVRCAVVGQVSEHCWRWPSSQADGETSSPMAARRSVSFARRASSTAMWIEVDSSSLRSASTVASYSRCSSGLRFGASGCSWP
jgi:hypothetical protein